MEYVDTIVIACAFSIIALVWLSWGRWAESMPPKAFETLIICIFIIWVLCLFAYWSYELQ